MWVSGSLIRSSTWRSSSVSAPCISSSISLPSSVARSRTMRGSFCHALPIGCMRVFMTPSCSSAVTLERRCNGTLNSDSSCRRTISSSWLRVSTSSETMVIRFSRVSTLTRIDWLATFESALSSSPSLGLRSALAGFGFASAFAGGASHFRGGSFDDGVAEGALELVERDFARTQRALQRLRHQRAGHRLRLRLRRGRRRAFHRHAFEVADQVAVRAFGLGLVLFEPGEDFLQAVDGREDERDGVAGHRHAVAELAHQGLGRVRQRLQARQAEESAGPLDGVDQAENVVEDLGVVRLLLEAHELHVDDVQALVGLGQELVQQVVHWTSDLRRQVRPPRPHNLSGANEVCWERVEEWLRGFRPGGKIPQFRTSRGDHHPGV